MKSTRFFAVFLALVVVLTALPVVIRAEEQKPADNHNIVIMVDSGGSLKQGITSDPNNYRFSAIGMFFDLLSNIGDHICVIDFKGNNKKNDSSDKAMRELIRCYPEDGLREITGREDKQQMMDFLRREAGGYTDIGTALLVAAEQLDGKTKENGLDSYIFLFTDGKTEFSDDAPEAYLQKSLENQKKALEIIRENGITLCAVYLDNGNRNATEVADLVRASITDNADEQVGFSDEELKEMGRYERVTSAADLSGVFQNFFTRLSSASMRELAPTDTFIIPGSTPGSLVREVNLCITTESSRDTVNLTEISSLVNSSSGPVSGEYLFSCRTYGESYVVYKLVDPQPGQYQIQWTSPDSGAKCRIIMDADLSADMTMDPVPEKVLFNNHINFQGWLCDQNGKLTDAAFYSGFTCVLEIVDQSTNQPIHRQEVFQNEDGMFSSYYPPTAYGTYYAQMSFVCGDLNIVSDRIAFQVINYPPTVTDDTVRISLSFGGDGIRELDLSEYISDPEDTELSSLAIAPHETNTYPKDAFEISRDNRTLTIRSHEGGSGTLTLSVSDTQGRNAVLTLQINARDNTLLILLLILLIAAALVLCYLRLRNQIQSDLFIRGKIIFTLRINGKPCRTRPLDAMECLHKDLYTTLSCRKNMLIREYAEFADFRGNAETEITEFLSRNCKLLETYRLIAVPQFKGNCKLRIVGNKPDDDPAPKSLANLLIPGEPVPQNQAYEIDLGQQDSCTIVYQSKESRAK